MNAIRYTQTCRNLGLFKNHRHPLWTFGPLRPHRADDVAQGIIKDLVVQKHQRTKCLIVRRRRYQPSDRQVC